MARTVITLTLAFFGAAGLAAQTPVPAATGTKSADAKPVIGLTFHEKFEGSTSGSTTVLDLNSTVGYNFSEHFGIDAGAPIYFLVPKAQKGTASNTTGMGNIYTDAHVDFDFGPVGYSSSLTVGLPTADTKKGLSTGRAMVDWDNRFDHNWDRFTPYVDIDPGNGINNLSNPHQRKAAFKRPFITLGKEVQFEAGTDVRLAGPLTLTLSAYDVAPWGDQKVYSLVLRRGQSGSGTARHGRVFENSALTKGTSDLVRDNGFNTALEAKVTRAVEFSIGYSRSVHYALNTVSFSVGFDLSRLAHPGPRH